MSLSRVKNWIDAEILTASDLNAEFNNILNYLNTGTFTASLIQTGDGTVSAPAWSFTADSDNGAYRVGTNNWALSAGATKAVDIGSAAVGFPDGTVSLPGVTFYSDTNNGAYRIGTDNWALAAAGIKGLELNTAANVLISVGLQIPDGNVSTPGIRFSGDTDNGAYRIGTNNWALSAAGTKALELSSAANVLISVGLQIPSGTLGTPGIVFSADTDCGIYRIGANNWGLVTAGAINLEMSTTGVGILDGTVSAPGLRFSADTGSGIYRNGANSWACTVNGSEVMELGYATAPCLGIGMATGGSGPPTLVVKGTGTTTGINIAGYDSTTTNTFRVLDNGNVTNTNGSYGVISSEILKRDITVLVDKTDVVKALGNSLITYRLKKEVDEKGDDATVITGATAESWKAIEPDLVSEAGEGLESINLMGACVLGLGALATLIERVEALEAKAK